MRWLPLLVVVSLACERERPPSAPPPAPVAELKPSPGAGSPSAAPAAPAEAAPSPTPDPAPAVGLQVGKALSLRQEESGRGAVPTEPPSPAEPEDPYAAAMRKAVEARTQNDARTAEVAYRTALAAKPKDPHALAGVAEMLFAQEKAEDALKPAELAYELLPTDPEVRWVFGLVMLSKNKRVDDAMAAWDALIKDTPDYAKGLGVPERLKIIKAYTKGAPHGGAKPQPAGPASAPK